MRSIVHVRSNMYVTRSQTCTYLITTNFCAHCSNSTTASTVINQFFFALFFCVCPLLSLELIICAKCSYFTGIQHHNTTQHNTIHCPLPRAPKPTPCATDAPTQTQGTVRVTQHVQNTHKHSV